MGNGEKKRNTNLPPSLFNVNVSNKFELGWQTSEAQSLQECGKEAAVALQGWTLLAEVCLKFPYETFSIVNK